MSKFVDRRGGYGREPPKFYSRHRNEEEENRINQAGMRKFTSSGTDYVRNFVG